jgi:hypothetical protein
MRKSVSITERSSLGKAVLELRAAPKLNFLKNRSQVIKVSPHLPRSNTPEAKKWAAPWTIVRVTKEFENDRIGEKH